MAQWTEGDIPDLAGKRALVTGAASGIGFETARSLALRGAEVWLLDYNVAAGQAAVDKIRCLRSDAAVRFLELDLGNQQAVRDFGAQLAAQGERLDLLINNAGTIATRERRTTVYGFERTFGIAHLGHFVLTAQLLPLLLKAPAPRVVSVSSLAHKLGSFHWEDLQMTRGYSGRRAYAQTKLANLLFALELQRRASAAGAALLSLAAHPGVSRTNIIRAERQSMAKAGVLDFLANRVLSGTISLMGQTAQAGALPTLYAATAPQAEGGGFYGPSGIGETRGAPARARIHRRALSPEKARRVWEVSEQLTGVRFPQL